MIGRGRPLRRKGVNVQEFSSDDVRIAYLDRPPAAGTPGRSCPVLLIHGFASHTDMNWVATGWVTHLAASGYRVISIDNRGHGRSEKLHDPRAYSARIMAEDACRLLDHLRVERAHVIGYSMGARIAALLAIGHASRVDHVVLGGLGLAMVEGMKGTDEIAVGLVAPALSEVRDPVARTFRVFAEQTQSDRTALAAAIRGAREAVPREDLARLRCRVLVACGSEDTISGSAEGLARIIPGATAFVIEGREHMKAVGDRTFKEAVVRFLET